VFPLTWIELLPTLTADTCALLSILQILPRNLSLTRAGHVPWEGRFGLGASGWTLGVAAVFRSSVLEAGCATALVAIVGIGPSSGAGGRSWPTGAAQVQSMGFIGW
jgi:hypothetical protein